MRPLNAFASNSSEIKLFGGFSDEPSEDESRPIAAD